MSDFASVEAPSFDTTISDVMPQAPATDSPASSSETVETAIAAGFPNVEIKSDAAVTVDSPDASDNPFSVTPDEFSKVLKDLGAEADDKSTTETPDGKLPDESVTENTEETTAKATDAEEAAKPLETDAESKLDFQTAPKPFREEYNRVKKQLVELETNSLEREFLVDVPKFFETLQAKSESQYAALVQQAATASAQANPDGWIEAFVQEYPDLVTQKLFGDEKLTKKRLVAEREAVDDDLLELWEDKEDSATKQLESPQLAELERLKKMEVERENSERETKRQTLEMETAAPVIDAVNRIYGDARLEVSPDDTPETKKFKEFLGKITPLYISDQLQNDPTIAPVFNKLNNFIENLDAKGAKNLELAIVSYAEAQAEQIAAFATHLLGDTEKRRTTPKSMLPPPVTLSAASSSTGSSESKDSVFSNDFGVSDAEFAEAIRKAA